MRLRKQAYGTRNLVGARVEQARSPAMRTLSKISSIMGAALLIASLPVTEITGIIGSIALIAVGTVGCIETEA